MLTRRLFLGGMLAGTAAPAIVRASSIMPIWVPPESVFGFSGPLYPFFGVDPARPGDDMTVLTQYRVLSGEIGLVDRFTIISTPHLPRRKPWR